VVFLLGFFDKKANAAGAFTALLGSLVVNIALKFGMPDVPFIIRIWFVFMGALFAAAIVSRATAAPDRERTVKLSDIAFATNALFNTLAAITIAMLLALYFWLW
jgi:SSS family solute:Na+ symporter